MEIRNCDQLTDRQTWVGARDTCVSKNLAKQFFCREKKYKYFVKSQSVGGQKEDFSRSVSHKQILEFGCALYHIVIILYRLCFISSVTQYYSYRIVSCSTYICPPFKIYVTIAVAVFGSNFNKLYRILVIYLFRPNTMFNNKMTDEI